MQHKLLLGSTALVSAGILMSGAAQAQETVGGLEVVLGGYTEFGGKAGQSLEDEPDRGYFFFMDNEVFINANGATDRGLQYGSKVELEVGSGNGNALNNEGNTDATVDEVALFFSSGWGRIELGREDGAEDVMGIGADAGRYRRHRRRHAEPGPIRDARHRRRRKGHLFHAPHHRLPARRQFVRSGQQHRD